MLLEMFLFKAGRDEVTNGDGMFLRTSTRSLTFCCGAKTWGTLVLTLSLYDRKEDASPNDI